MVVQPGSEDPDPSGPAPDPPAPYPWEHPSGWRGRLDELLDATGASARSLAVTVVVLVVLVGALVWSLRPPTPAVDDTLPQIRPETVAVPAPPEPAGSVVVHVSGAVVHPGVVEIAAGGRAVDAVTAAGGFRDDADPDRVNLAAPLADGAQLHVPAVGEVAPEAAAGGTGGPVPLNSATPAQLETLPGVGPATAAAIVEHRDRIGGFASVDQLLDVRGIGEAKLAALRDHVTL